MDELHFVSGKRKAQLKIKANVGSFICNTKAVGIDADALLKKMGFQSIFTWSYDPHGIISAPRVELKTTSYTHTSREEIIKYMNQDEWVEGSLQEAEEQVISTSNIQTPVPNSKQQKRVR